jgi:hypothetical protein
MISLDRSLRMPVQVIDQERYGRQRRDGQVQRYVCDIEFQSNLPYIIVTTIKEWHIYE